MIDIGEPGYDFIGDVHGEGTKLERLLTNMGYTNERGYYAHPTRTAIFVGDLVDRGPEQLLAVRTAKAMLASCQQACTTRRPSCSAHMGSVRNQLMISS